MKLRIADIIRYAYYFFIFNFKKVYQKSVSYLIYPNKAKSDPFEIKALADSAKDLNIVVEDIGYGAYEFKHGNTIRRLTADFKFDLENTFTFWLAGHKHLTYCLLEKYGITCLPFYKVYSFDTITDAKRTFLNRRKPVVIKPCFGTSGGQGVTVNIRDIRNLNKAVCNALMHDRYFLMEDFIEGEHFRVLLLKGRLLGVSKRIPAKITGDGHNSIKKLIQRENAKRLKDDPITALYPINIDSEVKHTLGRYDISLEFVPPKGKEIFVRSIVNLHAGGEVEDVTKLVNDDIVNVCQKVTKIMDIFLAGIDVITSDITKPLSETEGVINEVNTSPGLDAHYKVRNQEERRDVAKDILIEMFGIK